MRAVAEICIAPPPAVPFPDPSDFGMAKEPYTGLSVVLPAPMPPYPPWLAPETAESLAPDGDICNLIAYLVFTL